jgi:hypothetical protein
MNRDREKPHAGFLFFQFPDDGIGSDAQDPSRVANPAPVHSQIDNLSLHRG